MNRQSVNIGVAIAGLLLSYSFLCLAQNPDSQSFRDAVKQSDKAANNFHEIMQAPDHAIPRDVLDRAQCVVVFPDVIKAAFIFGGEGGRGVASCRTATGWSAPVYLHIGGGSWGAQIGAQSTDVVLVVMNHEGMESLLGDKVKLGATASIAAGPVGRQASAATDVRLGTEILSYSRSKGVFAGIDLSGAVITPDKDDMRAVYGPDVHSRAVLEGAVHAPRTADTFPKTLLSYSPAKGATEQGLGNQPAPAR